MPIFFLHMPELMRIIMTASSATARILSIAVLILSLAPLGSFYVLLFSAGVFPLEQTDAESGSGEQGMLTLAQILQNSNTTLDELWTALFVQQRLHFFVPDNPLTAYFPMMKQFHAQHHLYLVIPWIVSLFFGVLIPIIWTFWSMTRSQRHRIERRKRRLSKVILQLQNATKRLTANDKVADTAWRIVDARVTAEPCAICLQSFELNENVVWSPNPQCVHVFHEQCMIPWLGRKRTKHQVCPCCRQLFLKGKAE